MEVEVDLWATQHTLARARSHPARTLARARSLTHGALSRFRVLAHGLPMTRRHGGTILLLERMESAASEAIASNSSRLQVKQFHVDMDADMAVGGARVSSPGSA